MKDIGYYVVGTMLILSVILNYLLMFKVNKLEKEHKIEYVRTPYVVEYHNTDTIEINNIRNIHDTIINTRIDTIWKIYNDTIEFPIADYKYEKTYNDTNYILSIGCYGKKVADFNPIDSFSYDLTIFNDIPKVENTRFRFLIGPFIGVTYYEGIKPCVGLGVGIPLK